MVLTIGGAKVIVIDGRVRKPFIAEVFNLLPEDIRKGVMREERASQSRKRQRTFIEKSICVGREGKENLIVFWFIGVSMLKRVWMLIPESSVAVLMACRMMLASRGKPSFYNHHQIHRHHHHSLKHN